MRDRRGAYRCMGGRNLKERGYFEDLNVDMIIM
jgi:hypothetical protein